MKKLAKLAPGIGSIAMGISAMVVKPGILSGIVFALGLVVLGMGVYQVLKMKGD